MNENENELKLNLYQKIAGVSAMVLDMIPDKRHPDGYAYISSQKVLQEVGRAEAHYGVVVVPNILDVHVAHMDNIKSRSGKSPFFATLKMQMVLSDGDDTIEALWHGSGLSFNGPHNAIDSAVTNGHKYFLFKLYNIGGGVEEPGDKVDAMTPEELDALVADVRPLLDEGLIPIKIFQQLKDKHTITIPLINDLCVALNDEANTEEETDG